MSTRAPIASPELDAAPGHALALWTAALEAAGALEPTPAEPCAIGSACGRVAATEIRALHANPPHRCAAMDGIAVRAADTAGAPLELAPDRFAVIDTGQHVAAEWDAVVPLEELAWTDRGVSVLHAVASGGHVRPAGEDVAAGAPIIAAGRRLAPADVGLAAACGHATVSVRARPRATLIPTGDEVRPPGSELAPGEIPDSNGVMLQAQLERAGAAAELCAITPDDPALLESAVCAAAARSDVVLVLAGSSRGGRDHAAAVLERCGRLVVRGVALRPAHPVLLAVVDGRPVIGVPGYPVSAALAVERFVLPVIDALAGSRSAAPEQVRAELARSVLGRRDAELVVPVVLEPRAGEDPLALAPEPPRRRARGVRERRRQPVGRGRDG